MPKVVDHEARRGEVAAAVWRVVSREGLEAATIRRVAAEGGWSTGVLAHYFAGKDDIMRFAFELVVERGSARVTTAEGDRARALLAEALPLDDERRAEARVWFSFLGLAVTRPVLAAQQVRAYDTWRDAVAQALCDTGLAPGLDAHAEASALLALVDGIAIQATFQPDAFPPARQLALLDERLVALRRRR